MDPDELITLPLVLKFSILMQFIFVSFRVFKYCFVFHFFLVNIIRNELTSRDGCGDDKSFNISPAHLDFEVM